ncbi:MAG: hypothetical protein GC189_09795 [Alphaproteobacteria bacterium]|nr:hypothetical protein [Alphaproteobacteria bacterium]
MREIFLIARRDYLAVVSAWGFWLSLLTAPILLAVIALAPVVLTRSEPARALAVIADRAEDAAAVRKAFQAPPQDNARDAAQVRYVLVDPPAQTAEGLRPYLTGERTVSVIGEDRALFGALIIARSGDNVALTYWSTNLTDAMPRRRAQDALAGLMRQEALAARGVAGPEAERIEALAPTVEQFDPRRATAEGAVTVRDRAPFVVAIIFAFVLWSAVFGVANMLLTSVLEEKSNKILDTLLTSASPLQILIGKLLGVAAVSVTLFGMWGLLGGGVMNFAAARAPGDAVAGFADAALDPALLATFLICFAAGYLMYGAVFLALGSLCETIQEAQTLLGPVILVLTIPVILLGPAFDNPNAPFFAVASWIPPLTPFLMMVRAPAGLSPAELAGPFITVAIAVALILWGASRLFYAGVVDNANAASLRRRLLGRNEPGWRAPENAG